MGTIPTSPVSLFEAKSLSRKTGLRWQACRSWMQRKGFKDVGDIIRAYGHLGHDAGYAAVIAEIENLIFSLPMDDLGAAMMRKKLAKRPQNFDVSPLPLWSDGKHQQELF